MSFGIQCPKCGLMQLATSACKACGAPLGAAPRTTSSPPSPPDASRSEATAPPAAASAPTPRQRFAFAGSGWSLAGISAVNWLLILLTLGIYYFWGKVRVRRYLTGQTEFAGDRFAFHGTGKELLLGWLKVLLVFGLPIAALNLLASLGALGSALQIGLGVLASVAFVLFIPVATVGSRRYRLSRTSWREIRFSFRGRATQFLRIYLTGWLLSLLTLGIYYPYFDIRRYDFLTSNAYLGSQPFRFSGSGRDLLPTYLGCLLLTLPTLGLCWFWWSAKRQRYLWDRTGLGETRFRCTIRTGALLGLTVTNLLLILVTLGCAWPWTRIRSLRFVLRNLSLEGFVDYDRIRQDAQTADAAGEALAGFLDVGFDLG
jgi:uncharacterized membrane protein YjgN (DUF898 family)